MYTNIEAAKQLVKKYRKVTIAELKKLFEVYPNGEDVMREITGFGFPSTCMLCQYVDMIKCENGCKNCIWYSLFPVDECPCTEHETYKYIKYATDALELKQSLLDRAELLEEAIYEAEQENLRICE